ncbi:MAG: hypothetical protein O3C62_04140 [Actinomycetota bacterium]|nr:hypothetical protein [Actinomycetota bacterium]MDA2971105.1 hypothetical protein [Actinomycetota bacterium]MDA3000856.1 hypothetical protein [Actinomycetota bacterium]
MRIRGTLFALTCALTGALIVSSCGTDPSSDSSAAGARASALLVSELPEISGPTVLWFWAPG